MTTIRRVVSTQLFMVACCLISVSAVAVEGNYSLTAGIHQTNNIEKFSRDDGTDETIAIVGFGLSLREQTRRLQLEVEAVGEYHSYLNNTFSNEFLPFLNGLAQITLAEDRLAWVVEDNFGQVTNNTFDAASPSNRQNTNYFSTGPDIWFRLGGATVIKMSGRYSDNYFELLLADNSRLSGGMEIKRDLSAARSVSVNLETERVEFDDIPLNSNYDKQEAYLRFQSRISNGSVSVDLGGTEIHDGFETSSGALVRASIAREIGGGATVSLNFGRQFSDAGDIFRANQKSGLHSSDTQDQLALGDPFQATQFGVSYRNEFQTGKLSLDGRWLDEEYEKVSLFDRQTVAGDVEYQRTLTATMSGVLRAGFTRYDYSSLSRDDTDTDIAVSLLKNFAGQIGVELGVERRARSSSDTAQEYDENLGFVRAFYSRDIN